MAGATCAFCRRQPVVERWRPFCSERCKLQDLACWLDGDYKVAADQVDRDQDQSENLEGKT